MLATTMLAFVTVAAVCWIRHPSPPCRSGTFWRLAGVGGGRITLGVDHQEFRNRKRPMTTDRVAWIIGLCRSTIRSPSKSGRTARPRTPWKSGSAVTSVQW